MLGSIAHDLLPYRIRPVGICVWTVSGGRRINRADSQEASGVTTVIKLIRPQDVIAHSTIRCPLGHDIPVAKGFCFHGMSTATVLEFGPCECCPIDFGPWGEWRSILWLFDYHRINIESARLCCCEYCTGESCPFEGDCDNPDVECAIDNAQEDYNAVGWSP